MSIFFRFCIMNEVLQRSQTDSLETVAKEPRPRTLKTHLQFELLPKDFHQKKIKVWIVWRKKNRTLHPANPTHALEKKAQRSYRFQLSCEKYILYYSGNIVNPLTRSFFSVFLTLFVRKTSNQFARGQNKVEQSLDAFDLTRRTKIQKRSKCSRRVDFCQSFALFWLLS